MKDIWNALTMIFIVVIIAIALGLLVKVLELQGFIK